MNQETLFRINEIFYSIEGEGARVGEATIFIRFAGCNLQCPWCDTDFVDTRHRFTPSHVIEHLETSGWPARWVCLTGGEPMLQPADQLSKALREHGWRVHLETNGTYPIALGSFDYVTISPKMQEEVPHDRYPFLPENERVADEFKYVISRAEDLELVRWGEVVYLQPNWEAPAARQICIDAVLSHPGWRISLQAQKLIGLP